MKSVTTGTDKVLEVIQQKKRTICGETEIIFTTWIQFLLQTPYRVKAYKVTSILFPYYPLSKDIHLSSLCPNPYCHGVDQMAHELL